MNNQDLLRGSIDNLSTSALEKAFKWIKGEGEFPLPSSIHLNLTLRCSAKCIHCNQWTWPTHNEFSLEQFHKIFTIFKYWDVKSVTFGGGNPLMHPDVGEVLDIASKFNINSSIITEGGEISDELCEKIGTNASWIRFSIDGPTAEIHDKVRNSPGLFDKAINNIKFIKNKYPLLKIGINCVIQKSNIHQLDEMFDLADSTGVDYLLFKIPHGDDPLHKFIPKLEEWKIISDWVFQKSKISFNHFQTNLSELAFLLREIYNFDDLGIGKPTKNFYALNQVKCFTPFFFLTCDSEGYIYPCDYLQGDTRHWKGKYANMRNEFNVGNILDNPTLVISNLESLMKKKIMNLPSSGYDECGSCTRFCQLNYSLSQLGSILDNEEIDSETIEKILSRSETATTQTSFL